MKRVNTRRIVERAQRVVVSLVVLAAIILPGSTPARAQGVDYAGTSVANFLKIPVGARAMAMGGADLTTAADATGLFWNPGTLALMPGNNITFSHMPWLVDTQVNYVGVVYKTGFATYGLDLHFFDSGDIEETTLGEQDGTGRFVGTTSAQFGLAVGRSLTDRFSIGLKVKYISETLANVDASGFGMDIGAVFQTNLLRDLRLAFALTNFGAKLQYDGRDLRVTYPVPDNPEGKSVPAQLQTGEWDLPLGFRLGVSSDLLRGSQYRVSVNYSVFDARDYQPQHLIGSEVVLLDLLALRGGYIVRPDGDRYTLGAGLQVGYRDVARLRFDYSYAEQPYFSNAQQFTLGILF